MRAEDVRALAQATERVARMIELSGRADPRELLQVIETATRNPVIGFGEMCGLASRCGVNYITPDVSQAIARVSDTEARDLDEAQQAAYRIAYIRAVREPGPADEYVKVSEAAAMLDRTPIRVRQLIKEGKLGAERHGKLWYVSRADVERILGERGGHPG